MDPKFMFLILCFPLLLGTLTEGKPSIEKRIIHGTLAEEGELPYQVSLQFRYNYGDGDRKLRSTKNGGYCGAALISETMIVTATHCTKMTSPRNIKAVIGTKDLADEDSPVYEVDRIINGNYDADSKQNDISLLRIVRRSDENRKHAVVPVPICEESFDPEGLDCEVSGFGFVKWHKKGGGGKLRKAKIKVLHYETCTKMLKGHHWDPNNNSMLCAGSLDKDACQGDSGGPLVCPMPNGGRCLAGVVSWGVGCATPGFPGVYTNIRNYDKWINKNIECNKNGEETCKVDWEALGKEKAKEAVELGKEKTFESMEELEMGNRY